MWVRNIHEKFDIREPLDIPFRLVVGFYVAALITPAAVFAAPLRLTQGSALVVFGALGGAIFAFVTVSMTRFGAVAVRLGSGNTAWLLPVIPGIMLFAYLNAGVEYIMVSVSSLQTQSPQALVGFSGFILSIAAAFLGLVIVHMARFRLVHRSMNDTIIEWTAGWSKQRLIKTRIGVGILIVSVFSLGFFWDALPVFVTTYGCLVSIAWLVGIGTKKNYRAGSEGLEQVRESWLYGTRQFFFWEEFTGYSITDNEIVIYHQSPTKTVRLSRADVIEREPEIVQMLDQHLAGSR